MQRLGPLRDQAAIGHPLKLIEVPEAGAWAGMMKAGMTEEMANSVLELMRTGVGAAHEQVTTVVRDVTGAPARTFATWARDHARAFA